MLLRLIFWIFIGYLAYKFIFDLLIPTGNVTAQMKDKLREMQDRQQRMQEQMNRQQQQSSQNKPQTPPPSKDDYIDFEEIK